LAGNNRRAVEDARQEIDVEQKRILNELAAKLLLVVVSDPVLSGL